MFIMQGETQKLSSVSDNKEAPSFPPQQQLLNLEIKVRKILAIGWNNKIKLFLVS